MNDDYGFARFRIAVIKKAKDLFYQYPHCRMMDVIAEMVMEQLPVEPIEYLEENREATLLILERIVRNAYSLYKAELKDIGASGGQFTMFSTDNSTGSPKQAKKQASNKKPITGFKKKPQIQEQIEFDGEAPQQKSADPANLINIF